MIAFFHAGVWLSLAMLLSIVFRSPATAALVALGVWLFLSILRPMLAQAQAQAQAQVIAPPDPRFVMLGLETPETSIWVDSSGERQIANFRGHFPEQADQLPLDLVAAWRQCSTIEAGMSGGSAIRVAAISAPHCVEPSPTKLKADAISALLSPFDKVVPGKHEREDPATAMCATARSAASAHQRYAQF